jgi:hypothetical protein
MAILALAAVACVVWAIWAASRGRWRVAAIALGLALVAAAGEAILLYLVFGLDGGGPTG